MRPGLTTHTSTTSAGSDVRPVGLWVVAAAVSGTVMIGLGAFWLSFTALADLARRAGTVAQLSWVWPLIVDGVIVVATISVVALSRHGARATRYPWLLLAGGAAVSVSANVTHALVVADTAVPPLLAALVASVPPVVLLAITHLTVELTRYQRTGPRPIRNDTKPAARRNEAPPRRRAPTASPSTVIVGEAQSSALAAEAGPAVKEIGASTRAERRAPPTTPSGEARAAQAARLRSEGLSNRRIAAHLGVHPSTVGRWLVGTPMPGREPAQSSDDRRPPRYEGEDDDINE